MKDNGILYWLWLSERCGAASGEFRHIAEKYDDPFDIYRLEPYEIEHIEGIRESFKNALGDKSLDGAYSILRYCKANKVDIITYRDKRYPDRLKNIEDPPVLLYCLGKFPNMNSSLCMGVVGTRKMSEYGRQTSYKISYELASAGCVIVSGMALGIDSVSACGALAAGGKTVAVLGCGISVVYPREHESLMEEIARQGAVITEYPPFERPNARNFPKRNRIISGLCQGVLIVEGAAGSGALITASRAIDQGRELFALPGKVNESNSEGPNELIKNGANMVMGSEDIIGHYSFLYRDALDIRRYERSKKSSELSESVLKRLGVSAVYYRGRFEEDHEPIKTSEEAFGIAEAPLYKRSQKTVEEKKEKVSEEISEPSGEGLSEYEVNSLLEGLDGTCHRIYEMLPKSGTFTADLPVSRGIGIADVMTAFTFLEVSGLISSLPGGAYKIN